MPNHRVSSAGRSGGTRRGLRQQRWRFEYAEEAVTRGTDQSDDALGRENPGKRRRRYGRGVQRRKGPRSHEQSRDHRQLWVECPDRQRNLQHKPRPGYRHISMRRSRGRQTHEPDPRAESLEARRLGLGHPRRRSHRAGVPGVTSVGQRFERGYPAGNDSRLDDGACVAGERRRQHNGIGLELRPVLPSLSEHDRPWCGDQPRELGRPAAEFGRRSHRYQHAQLGRHAGRLLLDRVELHQTGLASARSRQKRGLHRLGPGPARRR